MPTFFQKSTVLQKSRLVVKGDEYSEIGCKSHPQHKRNIKPRRGFAVEKVENDHSRYACENKRRNDESKRF